MTKLVLELVFIAKRPAGGAQCWQWEEACQHRVVGGGGLAARRLVFAVEIKDPT